MRVSFGISRHSRTCSLLTGISGPPGMIVAFDDVADGGSAFADFGGAPVAGPPETVTAFPQAVSPSTRLAAITPSAARPALPSVLPSLTITASFLRYRTRPATARLPSPGPAPARTRRPRGGGPPVGRPRGPGGLALLPGPPWGWWSGLPGSPDRPALPSTARNTIRFPGSQVC